AGSGHQELPVFRAQVADHGDAAALHAQPRLLLVVEDAQMAGLAVVEAGSGAAQADQFAVPAEDIRMLRLVQLVPAQFGSFEGGGILRVGNVGGIPPEGGELAFSPFRNGTSHLRIFMVGKILEGRRCGPLLALKDERDERGGEHEGGGNFGSSKPGDVADPVPGGAVAYLVVVLDIAEELMPR